VLVDRADRYCQQHQRATWRQQAQARRADPGRRALDARYRSRQWRDYATSYRAHNPLCVVCKGKGLIVAAAVVDHIAPTASGGDFWEPSNHQSLCDACHRSKSAREVFHG